MKLERFTLAHAVAILLCAVPVIAIGAAILPFAVVFWLLNKITLATWEEPYGDPF